MTTEALDLAPSAAEDAKALRAHDIFERMRQGQSIPEIAEDLGLNRKTVQSVVQELAAYARTSAREMAQVAFLTADLRLNDLYAKTYAVATDETLDADSRLRGFALCLGIQTKLADLHQVGRHSQAGASTWVNLDSMTEAEILKSASLIGIPVPREIAEAAGVQSVSQRT